MERRFRHFARPLALAPLFLKDPRRIAGLLGVTVWSVTVLALMNVQVRHDLKGEPLHGLYPENRSSPSPTGSALPECFSTLSVVVAKTNPSR